MYLQGSMMEALRFGKLFWAICVLCVLLYSCILPFNNIASAFLVEEWYSKMPPAEARMQAGRVMSIIFAFSAIASPFFGYACDKVD